MLAISIINTRILASEEGAAGGEHEPVRRDDLIVRGDEGEVVEEAGGPQVLDGGPPAARVVGPLEPEHLPRQNLRHALKCSRRMQLRKNKMPPIIKKFAMNPKIFIVTRINLQVLIVLGQGGVLGVS